MNKIYTTALATAVSMALGGAALAQSNQDNQQGAANQHGQQSGQYHSFSSSEHGQRANEEMQRLDRNRDQRIDESEAQGDPQLVAAWADIDLSQDGSVDATEYYLFAATRTIAELESQQQGGASASSSNRSQQGFGQSQQSARSSQSAQGQRNQSQSQGGAQGQRNQSQGARSGAGASARVEATGQYPSFDEVDTDSDRQISRTELAMVEGLDFTTADENQDGYLSRQEYSDATSQ